MWISSQRGWPRIWGQKTMRMLLVCLCGLLSACVEHAIPEMMAGHDYTALPAPEEPPPTEGAIWKGDTALSSISRMTPTNSWPRIRGS